MNKEERIAKLVHAVTAYRGVRTIKHKVGDVVRTKTGSEIVKEQVDGWAVPPAPHKKEAVIRWCERLHLDPEQSLKAIDEFEFTQDFMAWLDTVREGTCPQLKKRST